jgi:hypothetical protein
MTKFVSFEATSLDIRPLSSYIASRSAHRRDVTGDGRLTGRMRFPRAGLVTSLPGGPGIALAGIMTGLRGAPLDWDSARRVTPARGTSQETRPGLSHGIHLRGKRRGGAPEGERARGAGEWQHSPAWRALHPLVQPSVRAFRRFASLLGRHVGRAFLQREAKLGCDSRIARTGSLAAAPAWRGRKANRMARTRRTPHP